MPMTSEREQHEGRVNRHYAAVQPRFSRWAGDYLRHGLWLPETRTLRKALENTDLFVAEKLNLSSNDNVLDAGCGVGASAIWMARRFGCRVTGVNLCGRQLAIARARAETAGVQERVRFVEADYARTGFEGRTFSGVFAIESVYHCWDAAAFAGEAFRLLKPGGRLVAIDRFLAGGDMSFLQHKRYDWFRAGQAVHRLPLVREFEQRLLSAGFAPVDVVDQTHWVLKVARRCAAASAVVLPWQLLLRALRLQSPELSRHSRSLMAMHFLFRQGVVRYVSFVASKPSLAEPVGSGLGQGSALRPPDQRAQSVPDQAKRAD
jgi:cyclopropane fatty-acyl-phospholipid synthase-like methyltransferase